MEVKFCPYCGDLMGLPTNENHLVFRWKGPGKVLFSVAQQGKAANAHFASDKKGLRYLKQACNDFTKFCFFLLPWCKMVLAHVGRPSIGRLIMKIGYSPFAKTVTGTAYMRLKP